MKKSLILILITLIIFAFSSCNGVVIYPESLLEPPMFSEEQREIYSALRDSIGDDFQLQYPTKGENRSAIVIEDLNSDGQNEALVIYKKEENQNTRVNVLSHTKDGWQTVCDVAGYSGEVSEVLFSNLAGTNQTSVIIGFDQVTSSTNTMLVYNYDDGRLFPVYIRDYSSLKIADINLDNENELVVINNNFSTRKSYMSVLYFENGEMVSLTEAPMNEDVLEYLSIKFGKIAGDIPALFVDSLLSSGSVITEVLVYNNNALTNFAYGYDSLLIDTTMRQNRILCEDIDNDGIIEIPTSLITPDGLKGNFVTLTSWQRFNGLNLNTAQVSADNLSYGYRLILPENWINDHSVQVNDIISNNEWRFVGFNSEENEYNETVLSIRVYSGEEIIDASSLSGYTKFLETSTHAYYAYIPENVSEEYKITIEQLKQNFKLI